MLKDKTVKFRLQNGLRATLYGPSSPELGRAVLGCANRKRKTLEFLLRYMSMSAVEVGLKGERCAWST